LELFKYETQKTYLIQWVEILLPPSIQIYLTPHVSLTFNLRTHNVDHFMPFTRGTFVPTGIKIVSFIIEILCS